MPGFVRQFSRLTKMEQHSDWGEKQEKVSYLIVLNQLPPIDISVVDPRIAKHLASFTLSSKD